MSGSNIKVQDSLVMGSNFLIFSLGRDIPFVAVYKTQRDGESETQDRESEYFKLFTDLHLQDSELC